MSEKTDYKNGQSKGSTCNKTRRRSSRPSEGGQQGNQNARKCGAYAKHFVSDQERAAFKDLRAELSKSFKKEEGAVSLELDMVCLMALRHGQALEKGDIDIAITLDTAVRNHLAVLKATRASRKTNVTPKQPQTTPAEWAADLLERTRRARAENEKMQANIKKAK